MVAVTIRCPRSASYTRKIELPMGVSLILSLIAIVEKIIAQGAQYYWANAHRPRHRSNSYALWHTEQNICALPQA